MVHFQNFLRMFFLLVSVLNYMVLDIFRPFLGYKEVRLVTKDTKQVRLTCFQLEALLQLRTNFVTFD